MVYYPTALLNNSPSVLGEVQLVKRNRVIVGSGLVIVMLVAATAGVGFMRKDLPYKFDIVPIDNGISITNLVSWNKRDLTVC